MSISRSNRATACHLLIISLLGALIYSNTLTSSFQFDDKLNIVDNPFIRDLANLWPPTGARWFGLLTFSLNYLAGGLNPFGYHIANTAIHILTALSVYLFVRLTFRTPFFSNRDGLVSGRWFAFACALLFVAHPIQTQAVTYIVQRFASLATLLFMLSLDCYILARLRTRDRDAAAPAAPPRARAARVSLYAASAGFALLSLKTKENAWTLPAVLILYDVMFISGRSQVTATLRKHWRIITSLCFTALAGLAFIISGHGLQPLFEKLKATNEISRYDYLITQFRVIVTYIRLLFFPVGQTIDHNHRVYHSIFEPSLLASLALLIILAASAFLLYRVSSRGKPCLRLVSFGIFWFFITLSIESSFIPISDIMFEHRLYLPSIGVILAVVAAAVYLLGRTRRERHRLRRAAACMLVVAVLILSYAAHLRNRVWKNELTLWGDVIAKDPRNPRGYNMVGNYYQSNFRIYDAIIYFRKALEVDSTYAGARSNLGVAYIMTGRFDEGLNELMITAANNRFDEIDTGILYYNIGKGFHLKGNTDLAIEYLNTALRYIPNEATVFYQLGEAYQRKNLAEQSEAYFRKARELAPHKY